MLPLPSPALIARYNRPGPRYTSYPAATEWTDAFGEAQLAHQLALADRSDAPLSLYVHIPFCPEMCRFCGCNVIATTDRTRADRYLDTLEREVALWAQRLPTRRRVTQLHLGGGTPTFLTVAQLRRLDAILRRHFEFLPGAERALEVDPAITTPEQIALLGELGFNRLSLGVQDLDPTVQQAINRIQSFEATDHVVRLARQAGFHSVNLDLIYGLPHQTPQSYARTIDQVLQMGPDRLALFGYAHVPWAKPNQRLLPQAFLPGPEARVELFVAAARRLEQMGFRQIGLDHFARRDDQLSRAQIDGTLTRNFQGYSNNAAPDTVAFGVSAISDVAGAFVQSFHKLNEWQAAVEAGRLPVERGLVRTDEDELRGAIIRQLMCLLRLDHASIERSYGTEAIHVFAGAEEKLRPLAADGLVTLHPGGLEVTPLGRLFLRNIAMAFDGRLANDKRQAFSRTV